MATKWRNKSAAAMLSIAILYLWAISLYAVVDLWQHKKYIDKDYYFSSHAFADEIELFSNLFLSYHITLKHHSERTPQEKIGLQRYNDLKTKSELAMKEKQSSFMQSYAVKIDQAQRSGDTNAAALWTEERDRKIAEARKLNDLDFDQNIQKLVAYKDQEYAGLKHSLDIRSNDIKYYFRNVNTYETYTNMSPVPGSLQELQASPVYRASLAQVDFPSIDPVSPSLKGVSRSFANSQLEGVMLIPSDAKGMSKFQTDNAYFLSIRERLLKELPLGAAGLLLGAGGWIYLRRQGMLEQLLPGVRAWWCRALPLELRAAAGLMVLVVLLVQVEPQSLFYLPPSGSQIIQLTLTAFWLGLVLLHAGGAIRLLHPRNREELRKEWERGLFRTFSRMGRESWAHKSVLFKLVCLLLFTALMGLLLGMMIEDSGPSNEYALVTILTILLYVLLVIPFILKYVVAWNRILQGTEQLAAGHFEASIPEQGGGQLSRLALQLNRMRHGFQQALEDRTKSERMKSELITNVSHDLKTPLTSIINYVNLLKREGITREETLQYIEVLDRKTDRLKVLIDDLFEASKMASGAVELDYDKVDIVALMHQALAEFSEKIEAASLSFRINASAPHVAAMLDGRKTWRVFENLISNAVKYSLAGTRVYITIAEQERGIELRMQNVSAYEIVFEVEELFERFKRGDQSRHTEGSGLGLAIAKSIVELQGGELRIEIDGDQFKVIVWFQKR
ncbi:sensor histidine kinase [Paenibacillus rigui]|uniref:histidine kinase n=1 Tax=Paenibacillus rigui TaxID=554312 RepID=A0A229UHC6_9BACL|nr:sensor histidine kinase [Paenibacillus rigui]OXM82359.1 sensor histidine kinase [Paenibacillus rigui]